MARSRTPKTRSRFENGRVIEYRHSYYWVPSELDDDHLRRGDDLEVRDIKRDLAEHLVKFGSQEQAECWGRIQQLGPSYKSYPVDYPHVDERHKSREDRCVPVTVAKEGKAKIAAYLYATNESKLAISNALDVSERAIGQYISDVRRGER